MQRDVGIEIAKDVGELLLRHDGELQHRVMICLWRRAKPQRSNNAQAGGERRLLQIAGRTALRLQEKDRGTIPVFL